MPYPDDKTGYIDVTICSCHILMIKLDTFFQLQGITLKLQPGSKVALVGPSGGGKVLPFLSFFLFF
jgi:ABC-type transport system involved in cytochrome bd biosynthesis fused ATPase/permease subunit